MVRLTSSILRSLAACCAIAGLAACSGPSGSGSSSSLITGSVFSSAPKAPVNPDDPATRPGKVAMLSASAVRCGFYFDPAKLRQSFIASQGGDAGTIQASYDNAYARASKALAGDGEFCTGAQVADIKSDLNRHLAGDFTIVAKVDKGPKQQTTWEWLKDGGQKADAGKMNTNEIFFPSGGAQTTMER